MKLKIVKNWRTGWRWFSVWSFALIVFFATTPLPPEITSLLPQNAQKYVIALVAACGLILRFVKQSDPANIKYRFDGKGVGGQSVKDGGHTDNNSSVIMQDKVDAAIKVNTAQAQTTQTKAVNSSGATHDRHH